MTTALARAADLTAAMAALARVAASARGGAWRSPAVVRFVSPKGLVELAERLLEASSDVMTFLVVEALEVRPFEPERQTKPSNSSPDYR